MGKRRHVKGATVGARAQGDQVRTFRNHGLHDGNVKNQVRVFRSGDQRKPIEKISTSSYMRFTPGTSPTSWEEVCRLGRSMEESSKLSFVAPVISADGSSYACIDRSEIDINARR